jgi:hypothetical protein
MAWSCCAQRMKRSSMMTTKSGTCTTRRKIANAGWPIAWRATMTMPRSCESSRECSRRIRDAWSCMLRCWRKDEYSFPHREVGRGVEVPCRTIAMTVPTSMHVRVSRAVSGWRTSLSTSPRSRAAWLM